jgi:hypothetical protein
VEQSYSHKGKAGQDDQGSGADQKGKPPGKTGLLGFPAAFPPGRGFLPLPAGLGGRAPAGAFF